MTSQKIEFNDPDLGILEFFQDSWTVDAIQTPKGEIYLSLSGLKGGPDKKMLKKTKQLFHDIEKYTAIAIQYIIEKEIAEISDENEDLVMCGLYMNNPNEFEIEYHLPKWEDSYFIVHFKNDRPYGVSMGD